MLFYNFSYCHSLMYVYMTMLHSANRYALAAFCKSLCIDFGFNANAQAFIVVIHVLLFLEGPTGCDAIGAPVPSCKHAIAGAQYTQRAQRIC